MHALFFDNIQGVDLRGIAPVNPIDSIGDIYIRRWQDRSAFLTNLWDTPLTKVGDIEVSAGPAVVGGLTLTIVASYAGAYAYYTAQQAEAAKEAEEKRKVMAERKAAAAAAKKAQEDKE